MPKSDDEDGYIIEYVTMGKTVKVTAFDSRNLKEASIIGPTSVPRKELARLAIRKLRYMIRKAKSKP